MVIILHIGSTIKFPGQNTLGDFIFRLYLSFEV